jgi:hypothetical protein
MPSNKRTSRTERARGAKKQPQAGILEHKNRPPFSPYQPHWTGLKAIIIISFLRETVKLTD